MDVRASDAERDATMHRLRDAAAQGRLTLEELTDRIEAAAGAVMRSDLVPLTSDLPATAAVGRPSQAPNVRGVGDVKRSGTWTVEAENSFRTWFGNIKLDLREAQIDAAETRIHARALFGNIDLLVPEGVEIDLQAGTQVGRTKVRARLRLSRSAAHRAHRRNVLRRRQGAPPAALGEARAAGWVDQLVHGRVRGCRCCPADSRATLLGAGP